MGADERRRARTELEIRAELKSADLEEDTGVIEREALSRAPKSSSVPAPARGLIAVLNTLPGWSRPIVLVVAILAVGGGGLLAVLRSLGWWK